MGEEGAGGWQAALLPHRVGQERLQKRMSLRVMQAGRVHFRRLPAAAASRHHTFAAAQSWQAQAPQK